MSTNRWPLTALHVGIGLLAGGALFHGQYKIVAGLLLLDGVVSLTTIVARS